MTQRFTTKLFESLNALADYAGASRGYRNSEEDLKWSDGTLRDNVRRLRDGDLRYVAQSDELLRKFESLTFATPRREWRAAEAGHVPAVPAFIAGHPQSMRRRRRVESEVAPVTIVVDVFASCAFSHADILARGAAVLALTRVLAAVRPVELYVGCGTTAYSGKSGFFAAKVPTTPLDLAHASFTLCGVGFLRQVAFSTLERMLPSDPFPALRESMAEIAAEILPHGTYVIAVEGVVSNITRDPAAWIEERIREAAPEVLGDRTA